jgi:hypothetical protein
LRDRTFAHNLIFGSRKNTGFCGQQKAGPTLCIRAGFHPRALLLYSIFN